MFDKYLAENGLKWSLWPDSNDKNPDRIVHTASGDVVCEIKDFGENDEYRELITNCKAGESSAGRADLSVATAKKVMKALDQLAVVKDGRPTMIVLHNPGYLPHELDFFVREALYGQPQLEVGIGPRESEEGQFHYGSATTGNDFNKGLFFKAELAHVSAVAVLETVKPNQQVYDDSLDAFYSRWKTNNSEAAKSALLAWDAIDEHKASFLVQFGADYLSKIVIRLRVYPNPYAMRKLPQAIFTGRRDVDLPVSQFLSNL